MPEGIKNLWNITNNIKQKGLKTEQQYDTQGNYEDFNRLKPETREEINKVVEEIEPLYQLLKRDIITKGNLKQVTADSPIKFDPRSLERDALFHIAVSRYRGQERIQEYIATLRLRIHRQLSDKRWSVFTEDITIDLKELLGQMIKQNESNIVIVDCSMLAYDVLPFFCAVFGRIVLELRAHALP